MKHSIVSAALALFASACAAGSGGPRDVEAQPNAILGGWEVTSDPEIGTFWGPKGPCTATLIAPNGILTAAHCFDYQTDTSESGDGGWFIYDNFSSERMITGYISLGDGSNSTNDIAVARLSSDVDGAWSRLWPHDIAPNFPTNPDEVMRIIGYGCGDPIVPDVGTPFCTKDSDYTVKRELDYYWWSLQDLKLTTAEAGKLNILVNGDSGGPSLDAYSRIVLVNSATEFDNIARTATDLFANVPANSTSIARAMGQLGIF
jgi:hypothetical protein